MRRFTNSTAAFSRRRHESWARIISFAGVAGDVLHAVMEKTIGELGGHRGQPANISGENGGVGFGVRKAAEDRADPAPACERILVVESEPGTTEPCGSVRSSKPRGGLLPTSGVL